jgi:hypothetical protein
MATATVQLYAQAQLKAWNKEIDWNDGTVKLALLTDGYTPDRTHDYFDHVVAAEVANGAGYTTDGAALTTPASAYVAAASATAWATLTTYKVGDIVRKVATNGHVYICIDPGTTAAGEPTWPTDGRETVADGTVLWAEYGIGYARFYDAGAVTWANSTITSRYGVLYADTGTTTTSPLIGLVDWAANLSSSDGDFTVTWGALGVFTIGVAFE